MNRLLSGNSNDNSWVVHKKSDQLFSDIDHFITLESSQSEVFGSFLLDVIMGTDKSESELRKNAELHEFDLSADYCIFVLKMNDEVPSDKPISKGNSIKLAVKSLHEALPQSKLWLKVFWADCAIFFVNCQEQGNPLAEVKKISPQLCEPPFSLGCGLHGSGILGIRRSFREGLFALYVGEAIYGPNRINTFDRLGLYSLLLEIDDTQTLRSYTNTILKKLQDYDQKHRTDYLSTLESYFRHNGNIKLIARELYVHYNSVGYRLKKIKQLLGIDLNDEEARLNLQLSLKIRKLIDLLEQEKRLPEKRLR